MPRIFRRVERDMSIDDVRKFLKAKLKLPELVTAAIEARHKEFGYNTFQEYVQNQTRWSTFKRNVSEEQVWKEIMEFLEKRYGAN